MDLTGERVTEVRIWNDLVGYAYWDKERQCALFQYDPSFVDKGCDLSPITLPPSNRAYVFDGLNKDTYQGLPGMLLDSLPDRYGSKILDLWFDCNMPKHELTPLDRLCYVGARGMGALEYQPSLGGADMKEPIDMERLALLASKVLSTEDARANLNGEGLQRLFDVGTSAGGARPKAIVGLDEGTGEIRSGHLDLPKEYTHWIVKFDTDAIRGRRFCRIEYAYHEMARACGINMAECRLFEIGGKTHFMTRRFDRVKGEKVHMQTLCALAHYDFKVPGRHSYEEMFGIMRSLHMPYEDMEQLFKRMVFNVILRNQDDHTKNFSFIMGRNGGWRLSPAYDLTYAFKPDNYWIRQHQMSANGKLCEFDRDDLMGVAYNAGIKDSNDIIDEVLSVASEWEGYAKQSEVPNEMVDLIGKNLLKV